VTDARDTPAGPGRREGRPRARRSPPARIRRRDGSVAPFDGRRIADAVRRAAEEVGAGDRTPADEVASRAIARLPARGTPGVEQVQDAVEGALMEMGLSDVARAYVVYRRRRADVREAKRLLGVRDELKLSVNAVALLRERYLLRDAHGEVTESTGEMMDRAARHVAAAEDAFRPGASGPAAEEFAAMLRALEFLPNSPTLMNAGTRVGVLGGCVVLPIEDSLDSIFTALHHSAILHQAGAGTGFAFSRLRPEGDRVASTQGTASGPVSFLRVFDAASEVIRQGGRRRGASMAVLDASHPDIRDFVAAKSASPALQTFNLSVGVGDRLMRAALAGGTHRLVSPRTGRTVGEMPAADLLSLIAEHAWRHGDPGLLFLDRINRANPLPGLGRIEATNPCGEVPLLPNESCTLGSVNLARHVRHGRLDWVALSRTVRRAVRFLDDVVEVSRHPFPELERAALATRKVGVGVMGLAELLAALGLPYDSTKAVRLAGAVARAVRAEARAASAELAAERGAFPLFDQSTFARAGLPPLRNAQLTSVAPTGSISIIAGTTSGIEPMFAVAFVRNALDTHLLEVNPLFDRMARSRGFHSDELIADIARTGGVRDDDRVPADVRRRFVTALDVAPSWHLRMQAAVQRHVDGAVSKTVNLPHDASAEDVRRIFVDAWRAGVKGITVYRYGSRPGQVLSLLADREPLPPVLADSSYAGGCAGHECAF
jgi:ribonucleoside-diphosphate reductase alpha chain